MIDTSQLTESDLSARLVPVALGGEIMSYGFARCFHEAYGVKTMVVSAVDVKVTSSSNLVDYRVVPAMGQGDDAIMDFLRKLGAELAAAGKVAIIFGSADWHARILSQNKEELSSGLLFRITILSCSTTSRRRNVSMRSARSWVSTTPKPGRSIARTRML